jgi:hypothetical protein
MAVVDQQYMTPTRSLARQPFGPAVDLLRNRRREGYYLAPSKTITQHFHFPL